MNQILQIIYEMNKPKDRELSREQMSEIKGRFLEGLAPQNLKRGSREPINIHLTDEQIIGYLVHQGFASNQEEGRELIPQVLDIRSYNHSTGLQLEIHQNERGYHLFHNAIPSI